MHSRLVAMSPSTSKPPSIRWPKLTLAIFAIASFSLVMATRGLLSGYSYWADELHSVTESLATWQDLYGKWLIVDVHPPLYQAILKLWMEVFGSSEISTRLLSFFFAGSTILILSIEALQERRARRVFALALIGLSPAFAFYAQETRSYSMALMLASLVTVLALRLRSFDQNTSNSDHPRGVAKVVVPGFYLAAIALSLTHYFGWIFIFSLSLISLIERRVEKSRWKTLGLIVLISLWPAWHISAGNLGGKTGGDFWIDVSIPIVGTVDNYLKGCMFPLALGGDSPYTFVSAWILLLSLTLLAFGSFRSIQNFLFSPSTQSPGLPDESRFLLLLILVMLSITSVIDIHTPMSTSRNFIVLLPATTLLVSNSLHALAFEGPPRNKGIRKAVSIFIALALAGLFSAQSYRALSGKILPRQNWKQLSVYVKTSGVCSEGCLVMGSYGLERYYFDQLGIRNLTNLSPSVLSVLSGESLARGSIQDQVNAEVQAALSEPTLPVIAGHVASGSARELTEGRANSICLQPSRGAPNSAFIVLPNDRLTGREKELGMKPCLLD